MWKLMGYNVADREFYVLQDKYDCKEQVEEAAEALLQELERLRPTYNSGGQSATGTQDRVFVICPDGTSYRFFERNRAHARDKV
jgi:uncharacterized protein (DUF169 family)